MLKGPAATGEKGNLTLGQRGSRRSESEFRFLRKEGKVRGEKINEDRAKQDPSYVYFEEIRKFPHFFQFKFFFAMENEVTREATFQFHFFRLKALIFYCCWVVWGCRGGVVGVLWGVVGCCGSWGWVLWGVRGACVGGSESRYHSLRFIIRIPW